MMEKCVINAVGLRGVRLGESSGGCRGMREQNHKERVRIRRIRPQGEHSLSHTLTSFTVYTHAHIHRLTHVTLETGLSRLKERNKKRKTVRDNRRARQSFILLRSKTYPEIEKQIFCLLLQCLAHTQCHLTSHFQGKHTHNLVHNNTTQEHHERHAVELQRCMKHHAGWLLGGMDGGEWQQQSSQTQSFGNRAERTPSPLTIAST